LSQRHCGAAPCSQCSAPPSLCDSPSVLWNQKDSQAKAKLKDPASSCQSISLSKGNNNGTPVETPSTQRLLRHLRIRHIGKFHSDHPPTRRSTGLLHHQVFELAKLLHFIANIRNGIFHILIAQQVLLGIEQVEQHQRLGRSV